MVAETLQFPDASDPVLRGQHVTFTIRLWLNGDVVVYQTFEKVEIPSFGVRGAVIDLKRVVGEVEVQARETLTVELLVGKWALEPSSPEFLRFQHRLDGDASRWIGTKVPALAHPWRLWYGIQDA